jgi:NAD(P)H-dependent flavin oxidoreductase YrpB (nitropropane dioxygenase family)
MTIFHAGFRMKAWPDRRILDLFGIELPIIVAPMAGPGNAALAIAVSEAGGLGSLPCAQLSTTEAACPAPTHPEPRLPETVSYFQLC